MTEYSEEKNLEPEIPVPSPEAELPEGEEPRDGQAEEPSPQAEEPAQPDPLAQLQEEKDAVNDRLLRVMAEYDNFRKRSAKERESLYPEAEAGVITRFLPFADNFERAMLSECADPEFKKGMELIWQAFEEILKDLRVEPVGEPGEPFDPKLHNAVMHIEDEALGENVIAEVFQKGYRRGERILRYAMVKTAN